MKSSWLGVRFGLKLAIAPFAPEFVGYLYMSQFEPVSRAARKNSEVSHLLHTISADRGGLWRIFISRE